ncbi:hypothetical protein [Nannocystis pusilla]|uniref:hypothetical protein n=1 Tax=Nannocystis pusilla TaxID=889268 RepID=UPI003B79C198
MLIVQGVALAMAMVTADAPAASASSKEQRVAAAYQQFEKQRHVEAALEFEALWRDFKEPRFLFNAAVTRYTARHYAHAVAYLNEYLALAEVKGPTAMRRRRSSRSRDARSRACRSACNPMGSRAHRR